MTDRHAGYVVVLDHSIREDDAETILTALRMVKGVVSVTPVVADVATVLAEARARSDLERKILEVFREVSA